MGALAPPENAAMRSLSEPALIVRDASVGECRCNEMCGQAEADGECDDGGPGSDYDWCDLGDDCACAAVGRMPDACRF